MASNSAHGHSTSECAHDHEHSHTAGDHSHHSHTEISPAKTHVEDVAGDAQIQASEREGESGMVSPEWFSKEANLPFNVEELVDAKIRGEDTTAMETSHNLNLTSIPLQSSTKRRPHIHKVWSFVLPCSLSSSFAFSFPLFARFLLRILAFSLALQQTDPHSNHAH